MFNVYYLCMNPERSMLVFVTVVVLFGLTTTFGVAQMTSTNYEIRFDHFGQGGDDSSSSASYQLRDTVGGTAVDPSTSTNYQETGGYRDGVFDEVATFDVFGMNTTTQVAASALASSTITVTSSAGFSVGDLIILVQDEGASQVSAIGEVASTGAGSITVDVLYPSSPTIDGTDDYVYNLSSTSVSFGTLSSSAVSTRVLAWEVDADVDDGYAVYVYEDEDLSSSDDLVSISDVADGAVSAGVSEYGARSSDSSLATSTFDTQDTAFTTTQQLVGSRSGFSFESRDFLTLKASISASQNDASYAHNLTFIYVGDY